MKKKPSPAARQTTKKAARIPSPRIPSPRVADDRQRRAELREIKARRRELAASAHRDLRDLRRQADRIVARHREQDAPLARRAAIVTTRLA